MMKNNYKHLGLRIPPELHYKLFYTAEFEARSGSRHILRILQEYIEAFEKEHGKIKTPENLDEKDKK